LIALGQSNSPDPVHAFRVLKRSGVTRASAVSERAL
jgi:hypothetical protein